MPAHRDRRPRASDALPDGCRATTPGWNRASVRRRGCWRRQDSLLGALARMQGDKGGPTIAHRNLKSLRRRGETASRQAIEQRKDAGLLGAPVQTREMPRRNCLCRSHAARAQTVSGRNSYWRRRSSVARHATQAMRAMPRLLSVSPSAGWAARTASRPRSPPGNATGQTAPRPSGRELRWFGFTFKARS